MTFEHVHEQQAGTKTASAPVLAVISRDAAVIDALRGTCRRLGAKCMHFKNWARLSDNGGERDMVAIVWDTREGATDASEAAPLGEGAVVITYGPPCPSEMMPAGSTVLNMGEGCDREALSQAAEMAVNAALSRRGLQEARKAVREAEGRLEESKKNGELLREHLSLYELQRNQLSEVVRRTAYLGQLSKELNCLDSDKIIDICVTKVPKLVDATLASIYVVNEETSELALKQSNHSQRIADRVPLEANLERLMTVAVERKATLLIRDIDTFALALKKPVDRTYAGKYKTRSCIIVPLMNDNRVMAVLNLADKANGLPFDEVRDLPLVDHISQFIGTALRNCELYQKVWQMAKTDALTGFINHNAFFDELSREIARVRRNKANLSLIILDVDNFKLFNDVHGHQVGDMVLSLVAQLVHNNVRTVDVAARYGGDEFAIILGDTDLERTEIVAERIRRAIASNQLTYDGQTFTVTISAGIAQYKMGQTLADMVNEADAALYRAKSKGRNAIAAGEKS